MRVVHVAPTAFGADGLFGGGERYPLELAAALSRHTACRLVTYGSRPRHAVDSRGLELVVLRAWHRVRRHPAHPVGAGLRRALAGADVVHAHQLHSRTTRRALGRASRHGQVRAVTDHGLAPSAGRDPWPLVDRFLAVSRYSAAVVGAPSERVDVVLGGADPERFRPDDTDRRAGVLFVGRLTPHKGVDRLLRALPDGTELTIAGTGGHDRVAPESGYVELLQQLAGEHGARVRFVGLVADDELPVLMRRHAVLALPSVETTCYGKHIAISELLGLVVIEAMASGTPVVASRIGGVPEVLADGETGHLVPPGDVAALHDALAGVLADHEGRRRMSRRSRELACSEFTWDACAQRCLASYEAALA
jgi:glycosyltransferase involved in cell wall biosynthesis